MLTFLAIACKQQFVINSYEDEAVGHLEKNIDGKLAITRVELRPKITWGQQSKPSVEELDKMHHAAHKNCFVANSVRTVVTVTKASSAALYGRTRPSGEVWANDPKRTFGPCFPNACGRPLALI